MNYLNHFRKIALVSLCLPLIISSAGIANADTAGMAKSRLEAQVGKNVVFSLKNGKTYSGKLMSFEYSPESRLVVLKEASSLGARAIVGFSADEIVSFEYLPPQSKK